MPSSSSIARSSWSLTIVWVNSPASLLCSRAGASRSSISPSLSVPRARSRRSSSSRFGAVMKIVMLPGIRSRTARAPPVSSSSRTGRPLPVMLSISDQSVPARLCSPQGHSTHSRNSSAASRRSNSSRLTKWYSRPSSSPGRRARVVAETASSSSGTRSSSIRARVLFPSPDVPVMTKTGGPLRPVEEPDELGALALRQPSNGLRLADPALIQEPGGLDAAELRYGHQDVEDLRRRDVLRRIAEHVVDVGGAGFEVFFQLRPADANVVRPLERFHALIQRAEGCLGLSLERWHERRILTSGARPSTMKKDGDLQDVYCTDIAAESAPVSELPAVWACARPITLSSSPTPRLAIS